MMKRIIHLNLRSSKSSSIDRNLILKAIFKFQRSSVTNLAKPNTVYDAGEAFSVYHFSFPLDWQFMVDEDLCNYFERMP